MELERRPKFTDLRIRTDQRLFVLLLRELDLALRGSEAAGGPDYFRLEKARAVASLLIPTMEGLSERQRALLRQRVDEAGRRLRGFTAAAAVA